MNRFIFLAYKVNLLAGILLRAVKGGVNNRFEAFTEIIDLFLLHYSLSD